jgi:hypothetical protein
MSGKRGHGALSVFGGREISGGAHSETIPCEPPLKKNEATRILVSHASAFRDADSTSLEASPSKEAPNVGKRGPGRSVSKTRNTPGAADLQAIFKGGHGAALPRFAERVGSAHSETRRAPLKKCDSDFGLSRVRI